MRRAGRTSAGTADPALAGTADVAWREAHTYDVLRAADLAGDADEGVDEGVDEGADERADDGSHDGTDAAARPVLQRSPGCDGTRCAAASLAAGESIWGRRPLQGVDSAELEPIALLLRQAVDERDAKRHRFG